jgi:hypothetical protein
VKFSWHILIPFLPFLRLSIPRLDSTTVVYSAVLRLLLLLSCPTLRITIVHGLHGKQESHAIMCGANHIENTVSSIFVKVCIPRRCLVIEIFVVAGMCLATRCLAIDVLWLRAHVLRECVYRSIA